MKIAVLYYFHENPTTFQSIKEVHSQLCPVKRQKTLANAEAEKLKRLASERAVTPVLSTQTASSAAGPQLAAAVSSSQATAQQQQKVHQSVVVILQSH